MSPLKDLLATAESHIVSRRDLAVDPKMQMRVEMDHGLIEEYTDTIAEILDESPIRVVIVEQALGEVFYVVDGYHRYYAALAADLMEIPATVYRGTFEQALQLAMSANFANGARPSKEDGKKAIRRLLDTAPDFGYDSKQVIPWLETFGIPKTTARDNTKDVRQELDEARDAKIMELHDAGLSNVDIGKQVGCSDMTVGRRLESLSNLLTSTNERAAQMLSPGPTSEDMSEFGGFTAEECEEPVIVNPMDAVIEKRKAQALEQTEAMNKALQEHADDIRNPTESKSNILATLRQLLELSEKDPSAFDSSSKFLVKKLALSLSSIK